MELEGLMAGTGPGSFNDSPSQGGKSHKCRHARSGACEDSLPDDGVVDVSQTARPAFADEVVKPHSGLFGAYPYWAGRRANSEVLPQAVLVSRRTEDLFIADGRDLFLATATAGNLASLSCPIWVLNPRGSPGRPP